MASSVLVIGAGELGKEIIHALAQHPSRNNTSIAVLLRQGTMDNATGDKKALLQDMQQTHNVSLVPGDIASDTAAQLSQLFAQYHTVVAASGMVQDKGTQTKVTEAVLAATQAPASKTRRYIPWQFGLDYDAIGPDSAGGLFAEQIRIREMLRRSEDRLEWVIISTGIFTSFLFEDFFGVVQVRPEGAIVRALGSWQNTVTYTAPVDIGRLTAEVVLARPEIKNCPVFMAGETASFGDVRRVVEGVLGREVQGEELSVHDLRQRMAAEPQNGLLKFSVVLAEGVGVAWEKSGSSNARWGLPAMTVEDFAREVWREGS